MESSQADRSTTPPAPWLGGKRNLAGRLVKEIELVPHSTYVEPFCGMAGVFLRRRQAVKCEVINDANGEVANFFRVVQRHHQPFLDMIRYQVTSRKEFECLAGQDPSRLTDMERAARFLYLQRIAFGGRPTGRTFGTARDRPGRFDISKVGPLLQELHERLSAVVLECLDWREILRRYDGAHTLCYLDPPYHGNEQDYGRELFARDDFAEMADRLAGLAGRFVLSINDTPQIRELFGRFDVEAVNTTYTVARRGSSGSKQLIVRGP